MTASSAPTTKELGQAFYDALTPLASKLVSTPLEWDAKTRKVPGTDLHIEFLGVSVDGEEPCDADLAKFGRLLNWLVKEDLVQHGVIICPLWMSLTPECTVCGLLYGTLTSTPIEEIHIACIETAGVTPPPLRHRGMLLAYPATRFSREELNRRIVAENFTEEGVLPPEGWPTFE